METNSTYMLSRKKIIEIFNIGYHKGHNDTVEGYFIDIKNVDMQEVHSDIINDILDDLTA